jgi:hypothetical protein
MGALIVAVLAHIDFEFFGGAAALPAVVAVAEAEGGFAAGDGESAARRKLDVEESEERAAELGEGEGALLGKKHGERDEHVDGDEVPGLDGNGEGKHHEGRVGVEDADGDEQAEDAAEATVEHESGARHGEGERDGSESGAEDGDEEQLGEPAGAVAVFEEAAQEPEGEQLKGGAEDGCAGVDDEVGEELPDPSVMQDEIGVKGEDRGDLRGKRSGDDAEDQQAEIGAEIPEDERAGETAEIGEAENAAGETRHRGYCLIGGAGREGGGYRGKEWRTIAESNGGGRLAGMKLALSAVLFASWAAMPMAANPRAVAKGQTGAGTAGSPAARVYSNPEFHLTFSYPAELTPTSAAPLAIVGRRMVYGGDEEGDPDHPGTDTCAKVLLSVGKGNQNGSGASNPWVRLGLLDVSAQCFPAKVFEKKKTIDGLLRNLVKQGTTLMGLMPLEQPAAYEIEGHRANFCAAQGQPVTGSDLQTGGQELIGVAVVAVPGHVVAWVIETSDAAVFNQLLGSPVDFGAGKMERLFPGVARGN